MDDMNDTTPKQPDTADAATTGTSAYTAPAVSPVTARGRKKQKGATTEKSAYGKNNFRLPVHYERALRYIALLLENTPQAVTAQELVEDAVMRHVEYWRKKGIEIPEAILPTGK